MPTTDIVYYWKNGSWHPALPNVWPDYLTSHKLVANLVTAGYPTVNGCANVGPPEGPPGHPGKVPNTD